MAKTALHVVRSETSRLAVHPVLRDVFPPLTREEHERTVERVKLHGQREPIEVLDGQIVAGAAEYDACVASGVKPTLTRIAEPDCIVTYIIRRNIPRELSALDRACIAVLAYEAIAKEMGRERQSQGAHLRSKMTRTSVSTAENRPFAGERWFQTAAKLVGCNPTTVKQLASLRSKAPDVFASIRARRITVIRDAQQLVKRVETPKERATVLHRAASSKLPMSALTYDHVREKRVAAMPPGLPEGKRYILHTGSLEEHGRKVKSESVDLVYADVPYGNDGVELSAQIAVLAKRVLVPGGILALQPGHIRFAEAANHVSRLLCCFAVGFISYRAAGDGLLGRRLVMRLDCDPILFACKGKMPKKPIAHLCYEPASEREKTLFSWQKPLSVMTDLILSAVGKGAIVLDPVCGSATTGVAALRLGGQFIGIDVDPQRVRKLAAPRLAAVERELGLGPALRRVS